jgi:hypothetical protein
MSEEVSSVEQLTLSLLGRIAFKNDDLKILVQKGSKKPVQVLAAYNLCDGNTPVTTIARRARIAQPSLTVALAKWERLGIVLKKKRGSEILPLGLFRIQ